MKPTDGQKNRARQSSRISKRVERLGWFASTAIAAIPPSVHAVAPAAVAVAVGFLGDHFDDVAHDPPRADYEQPSQVRESTLELAALTEFPLGVATVPLIDSVDTAARLLEVGALAGPVGERSARAPRCSPEAA